MRRLSGGNHTQKLAKISGGKKKKKSISVRRFLLTSDHQGLSTSQSQVALKQRDNQRPNHVRRHVFLAVTSLPDPVGALLSSFAAVNCHVCITLTLSYGDWTNSLYAPITFGLDCLGSLQSSRAHYYCSFFSVWVQSFYEHIITCFFYHSLSVYPIIWRCGFTVIHCNVESPVGFQSEQQRRKGF